MLKNDKLKIITEIRRETSFPIMEIKRALEKANFDKKRALKILLKKGVEKQFARKDKEVKAGRIEAYSHRGQIGVLVEVDSETDFVALSEDFKNFTHELALQIASMSPKDVEELLTQEYIKDPSKKISDLLLELQTKVGEKIVINRFVRLEIGEK